MGGKGAKAWKHLYLPFTILIFSLITGCSTLEKIRAKVRGEAYQYLLEGQKLLAEGDYEGALRGNEKVILLSPPGPSADQALFNMGMIHAHPGNPKKDYGKSAIFLGKVLEDYPKSPLAEHAKTWIGILQTHDELKEMIKKLGQKVEEQNRTLEGIRALRERKLLVQGDYEGALSGGWKAGERNKN